MRRRLFSLASALLLALAFSFYCPQAARAGDATSPPPASDPTDANIAQIEADMLQTWQYSQHPFDQEISSRFLDRYLEVLDYSHMYFLQSDIKEFEHYRTNLNVLTLQDHDMTPCWVIFSRFMRRANERINYVTNLLATAAFEFNGHDRFVVNRHALPYPKDMTEAMEFWRQEVRCEYLEQLLEAQGIEFTGTSSPTGTAPRPAQFHFRGTKRVRWISIIFPKNCKARTDRQLASVAIQPRRLQCHRACCNGRRGRT